MFDPTDPEDKDDNTLDDLAEEIDDQIESDNDDSSNDDSNSDDEE